MRCGKQTLWVVIVLCLAFGGCGFFRERQEMRSTPEYLYQRGYELYQDGNYKEALRFFERLTEQYPLSKYAVLAELGIADSHFSNGQYAEADVVYRGFMDYRPANENLPYVMYQIGLCAYKQMIGIDRDQSMTMLARESFELLIARYPQSQFAFKAEKYLQDCKRRLGEHEFYVGEFYFKQGEYKAALKRFETIQKEYPHLGLDYKVSYFVHLAKRKLEEAQVSANK